MYRELIGSVEGRLERISTALIETVAGYAVGVPTPALEKNDRSA
jgi:hypothetical protein